MKKGPLSNKEKDFVQKNYLTMTEKELCMKMERAKNIIRKYVFGLSFEKQEETATKEKPEPVNVAPDNKAGSMFARNKERNATIMTEAASAKGDASRVASRDPKRYRNIIHTIKED